MIQKVLELTRQPGSHGHAPFFFFFLNGEVRVSLSRLVAGGERGLMCRLAASADNKSLCMFLFVNMHACVQYYEVLLKKNRT